MRPGSFCILTIIIALFLNACGGSSSGGDSSANARNGVRLLNASIELPPLDLYSSRDEKESLIQRTAFMQNAFFADVSGAEQTLFVTTAQRPGEERFSVPVEQDLLGRMTILIYGDRSTFGERINSFVEPEVEIPSGKGAVRIIHGATRAQQISTALGEETLPLVSFGSASEYHFLEPGELEYVVRRAVDQLVIASGLIEIEADRAYTLLVGGEVEYFVTVRQLLDRP